MARTIELLLVEDNADDAEILLHVLTSAGLDLRWSRVETEMDFLACLEKNPDVILSDYSMPAFSGLRALELLVQSGRDIPLVLISGTVGEDVAVEAMRLGATDYLLKDRTVRLPNAVERALNEKRLRQDKVQAEMQIKRQLQELQEWREVTLGREERVQALKIEVNELLRLVGKEPRYAEYTAPDGAP